MSIDKLINDKLRRLDSIADAYSTASKKIQQLMFREISGLISQLEKSGDTIKPSANNLKTVSQINDRLRVILSGPEYQEVIKSLLQEFDQQAKINVDIAKDILPDFDGEEFIKQYLSVAKSLAAQTLVDVSNSSLSKDISTYLTEAISNGQSYSETFDFVESYLKGAEGAEGALVKYTKQIVNDSFAAADRSVNETIATSNGVQFFKYQGGEVEDTRCFCNVRRGKVYHRKEIESWGDGRNEGVPDGSECGYPWQGMNKNTTTSTVFVYLGGYNCRHSLILVSEINVPRDVAIRAYRSGYYKPSAKMKKHFGII